MPHPPASSPTPLGRRDFMAYFSGIGLGGTLLPGVLWAESDAARDITAETVARAAEIAGLEFTEDEREMMLRGLQGNLQSYQALRAVEIPNEVPPAVQFDPALPHRRPAAGIGLVRPSRTPDLVAPASIDEVAFWPVSHLSELVRSRQVSSEELTRMYLRRLEAHGPTLEAVITLTADRALRQARRADREISRGEYRGPLHGIPWGAKDLLAVDGYPTTWGATPFQAQVRSDDATVVRRLDEAGAVLVAKLTLGALAMGDNWFGGRTRNPWNLEQGSSGSSAGSAAATVAGLVGFSIGTETLGSIVSPSTRTGATGLRPTFGRVSRNGAMALSWSMDKLGPICRAVEDCALVFDAIHGADGRDPTARSVAFDWDPRQELDDLRVGYIASAFEGENADPDDQRLLDLARELGMEPSPIELPDDLPLGALRVILNAEAAAAFDDLTRSDRDAELVQQTAGSWPNAFRTARFIPAVEYIQANRVRTMLQGRLDAAFDGFDAVLTPSFASDVLLMTNLTGHPVTVFPHAFDGAGSPKSFSVLGGLYGDSASLRVAKRLQDALDLQPKVPPLFAV